MGMLIIGSEAMQGMYEGVRPAKDLDVWCRNRIGSHDQFWDDRLAEFRYDTGGPLIPTRGCRRVTMDELYTIKVSHSYWELRNGSWNKHMFDVVKLKQAGARLHQELHDFLYKIWEDTHGRKVVDLQKESDEFFSDAVKRKYVHDSLHASVAYGNAPMYEGLLKPGKSVQMDMFRVKQLPDDDIAKLFREEVYVTALERILVPKDYLYSARAAYAWALRRTITSLTKGWSAQWLVENYDVMRSPDVDYVKVHLSNKDKLEVA